MPIIYLSLHLLLALSSGFGSAAPVVYTTAAPPRPSVIAALAARADTLPDFGNEIVTATQDGTVYTFVHHIGIAFSNDIENNEVIQVSQSLKEAVYNLVADSSICSRPAKRSIFNETVLSDIEIRDDSDIISDLLADDCFIDRMGVAFSQMRADPAGVLSNVIPSTGSSTQFSDFIDTVSAAFELAYARFDTDQYFTWVSVRNKRLSVSVLGVIMILAAKNIHIQNRIILNNRLFRKTSEDIRECEEEENAPACVESNCHGENGRCTSKVNEGCGCWPLVGPSEDYLFDSTLLKIQQQMLIEASRPALGKPSCLGVTTRNSVTRGAGAVAIGEFCGTQIPKDTPEYSQEFNHESPNWLRLSITFGGITSMLSDDCKRFLTAILDGCDDTNHGADNPADLRHGGTIQYGAATFELTPLSGNPIHCYTFARKNWVDIAVGLSAEEQFCKDSLTGHAGDRIEKLYNEGKDTAVLVTASYYKDLTLTNAECVSQLRAPLDNCDHEDPVNNPLDNKYGGIYANEQGLILMVTPWTVPKSFPPSNVNGNPECLTKASGPSIDDVVKASLDYCVDGKDLYSFEYSNKKKKIRLSAEMINDPENTYTECRYTSDWHPGKIRAGDCKYAMQQMHSSDCKKAAYNYHCIRWSYEKV